MNRGEMCRRRGTPCRTAIVSTTSAKGEGRGGGHLRLAITSLAGSVIGRSSVRVCGGTTATMRRHAKAVGRALSQISQVVRRMVVTPC